MTLELEELDCGNCDHLKCPLRGYGCKGKWHSEATKK